MHAALVVSLLAFAADKPAAPVAALARLAVTYKIDVVTDPKFPARSLFGVIDGKAANETELAGYAGLFVREFSLYPPALVKRCQLKRVVLCKELSFAGQRRNAIPDYADDTLYLDVVRGHYDRKYLCKVIHHEFFHILDWKDDGFVYRDERWSALNPAGFKYGNGGKNAQNRAATAVLTDRFPGFLNHYSTTGVEEDKAEVFANLIVDAARVEARVRTDAVLKAKVVRMKELTAAFCPDVNQAFWERARTTDRSAARPATVDGPQPRP